jgi:branched-subunit amino acid ABC-type transport system permease component
VEITQLIVIGIINGSLYALLAVGFGLILQVTGRFHIAFAITYALAGYAAAYTTTNYGLNFWAAMALGALVATVVGVAIEAFVYWPLGPRAGNFALLAIFTASLGLLTVGQAAMGLVLINSGTAQIAGFLIQPLNAGQIYFTNLDVVTVVVCWVAIAAVSVLMVTTKLGRMVRAVRSNVTMSLAVGISPRMVFLVIFGLGSALGGLGGVLAASKSAVASDSGQAAILYALTIAFLAGLTASPGRIAVVGLGLGIVESVANLWVSPVWDPVIVYGLLLLYAALKPFDVLSHLHGLRRPQLALES